MRVTVGVEVAPRAAGRRVPTPVAITLMVLALLAAAGAWAAVRTGGGSPAGHVLPDGLAGIPLTHRTVGEDAVRVVVGLHLGEVPVDVAEVGLYGEGAIQVWASWVEGAPADRLVERMTRRIAEGGTPFSVPTEHAPGVWRLVGLGREHAYFAREGWVWWVSAEPGLLGPALEDLAG